MAGMKIDKKKWRDYFDYVSKELVGSHAQIETASLQIGSQIQADWVPLLGIVYDQERDKIEIALEGLDHFVANPDEVHVDAHPGGLTSLEIVDRSGVQQIIKLREPLMLPPATS